MAATQRPELKIQDRAERGSRATRRLRRQGLVPGVVYGGTDRGCTAFSVDARELRRVLLAGSAVFDVAVDGQARPVIVKDQHHHPVRDHVIHIDLLEVRLDEKIQTTVALEITGVEEAPGVKEGGVLEHVTREINVEALPTDVPDRLVADVSGMGIADTMTLSSVKPPPGVELLDDLEETVIATVSAPTKVEEPEPELEALGDVVGQRLDVDLARDVLEHAALLGPGGVLAAQELEGVEEAPGVKEGGIVEHVTRELNIEALPTSIPENITVDVSHLEIAEPEIEEEAELVGEDGEPIEAPEGEEGEAPAEGEPGEAAEAPASEESGGDES